MADHVNGEGVNLIIEGHVSELSLPLLDVLLPDGVGLLGKRGHCILLLDLVDEVVVGRGRIQTY